MKKSLIITIAAILVFVFAACSAANPTQDAGTTNLKQNGAKVDDGSIRGIVTAVSSNSIEIAKMTGGPGNERSGSQPSGTPDGNPPSDGQQQPPASGSQPAQPSFDTSNMEKVTYTIDTNTQIVKREFERGTGQNRSQTPAETAASISDIQQGTMVSITPQTGNDKAAAKIVITQGLGMRGSNQPNGNNPAASGSAPSASASSAS